MKKDVSWYPDGRKYLFVRDVNGVLKVRQLGGVKVHQ
jgi:hypothetical protein